MKVRFPYFDTIGMSLLGTTALLLFVLESKRQLRKRTRLKPQRLKENAGVAALALPALRLLLLPCRYASAQKAAKYRMGLLYWSGMPKWFHYVAGFLLLDYTNYMWHVLLHKSDLLWRFHNVHHMDLDLDHSTAWRFHVGENIASAPCRNAAVALIGIPAPLVLFYEVIFEGCTAFHHSNLRLPVKAEQWLCRIMVTPRMHGIHHSIVARETNSNFTVIFSWWDRLHKSLLLHVAQADITIGVPAYRDPNEQSAFNLFAIPFKKQRTWQQPDGTVPQRQERQPLVKLYP
ncbi:sterol desaturase family protein [Pontibacter liquoris]|uniref:sterol desaturase family protein n=1 Tax=Pontibacter liquoris TaxID=2905677 RepID=UPI001FA7EDCE|nr:sterol desaturase family protein [Pontibacter liquoris]